MKKKKRSLRSKSKHPGLKKSLNLKVRQELIDYDYIDKLTDEEKDWLNRFSEEYNGAKFKKTKTGKFSSKNLHKGEMRKDCYNRNNWRNNDVYSVEKAKNMLKDNKTMVSHLEEESFKTPSEIEDVLIEEIDKNSLED